MPLGNLTSQFFANVYLNELDYFVKHTLQANYYLRYVDDFLILHASQSQLEDWKKRIDSFLKEKLQLHIHPNKSKIIPLARGIDFVGFRNFYYFKLLRKRNIRNILHKINKYSKGSLSFSQVFDSWKGWEAYARWANTHALRKKLKLKIASELYEKM